MTTGFFSELAPGLEFPPDMPVDEWADVGRRLGAASDASRWGIGDWLVFGERAYGEDAVAQAVEVTGRSKSTLLKYRWVAANIPLERRRQNLTYTHHEIVARLPMEIADGWLDDAQAWGWSVEELRGHVRPDKPQTECTCVVDPDCPKHGDHA